MSVAQPPAGVSGLHSDLSTGAAVLCRGQDKCEHLGFLSPTLTPLSTCLYLAWSRDGAVGWGLSVGGIVLCVLATLVELHIIGIVFLVGLKYFTEIINTFLNMFLFYCMFSISRMENILAKSYNYRCFNWIFILD